jgi:predicted CXXCH cytochrome family protein
MFLRGIIHTIVILSLLLPCSVYAKVTGSCANCHTMHNSQSGSAVAREGSGVGWSGGPDWELTGGSQADNAGSSLVVADCIGCHSSNTSDVIVEFGGSRVPIVYNVSGLSDTATTLAGGNFCWVNTKGQGYGHNVMGISGVDTNLDQAPGNNRSCGGGAGCHFSLAVENTSHRSGTEGKSGCQGCHVYVTHHGDAALDAYRFLRGHNANAYVVGKEDPDWEVDASASKHNEYKGDPNDNKSLPDGNNMSAYCTGCHWDFHDQGSSGTWIRHPSDAVLPTTGEYAAYTTYNPEAPVARPDPENVADPSTVTRGDGGDMVMCLSCHRPHGSPYPDILRWDYDTMNAGGGGSDGCFICHTGKNGS